MVPANSLAPLPSGQDSTSIKGVTVCITSSDDDEEIGEKHDSSGEEQLGGITREFALLLHPPAFVVSGSSSVQNHADFAVRTPSPELVPRLVAWQAARAQDDDELLKALSGASITTDSALATGHLHSLPLTALSAKPHPFDNPDNQFDILEDDYDDNDMQGMSGYLCREDDAKTRGVCLEEPWQDEEYDVYMLRSCAPCSLHQEEFPDDEEFPEGEEEEEDPRNGESDFQDGEDDDFREGGEQGEEEPLEHDEDGLATGIKAKRWGEMTSSDSDSSFDPREVVRRRENKEEPRIPQPQAERYLPDGQPSHFDVDWESLYFTPYEVDSSPSSYAGRVETCQQGHKQYRKPKIANGGSAKRSARRKPHAVHAKVALKAAVLSRIIADLQSAIEQARTAKLPEKNPDLEEAKKTLAEEQRKADAQVCVEGAPADDDEANSATDCAELDDDDAVKNDNANDDDTLSPVYAPKMEAVKAGGKQREEAIAWLCDNALKHTFDPDGCKVMQEAFRNCSTVMRQCFADALRLCVWNCIDHPYGNHVIQEVVQAWPTTQSRFVADALQGWCLVTAKHRYGCRILCRLFEHTIDECGTVLLIEELNSWYGVLSCDKYGQHVVISILNNGTPIQQKQVADDFITYGVLSLATHRIANKVVAKALEMCEDRSMLANELLSGRGRAVLRKKFRYSKTVLKAIWKLGGTHRQSVEAYFEQNPEYFKETKNGKRVLKDLRHEEGIISVKA